MWRWLRVALVWASGGIILGQGQSQTTPAQQTGAHGESQSSPEKKKEKKESRRQDDIEVFSDAVANNIMADLRDGLEGHSPRLLLSAFDGDKMEGYLSFKDEMENFFNRYQAFRVRYRILQTAVEGARGIILVDFEMEETPRNEMAAPARKSSQVRFELERGRKGWKIVDFRPRGFFS
jgi:hypothetical protein